VHVALVQSSPAAGQAFGTPLSAADSDRYVAEMMVAASSPRAPAPDPRQRRGTRPVYLAVFYDSIREPRPLTITGDYASSVARRFFDLRSPVAGYISVPRSYVILQRINLGLFAVLGELSATADWRAVAEEIWPFVQGPPSTPMGQAEAAWRAQRQAIAA
jgi:hypothetical protein